MEVVDCPVGKGVWDVEIWEWEKGKVGLGGSLGSWTAGMGIRLGFLRAGMG